MYFAVIGNHPQITLAELQLVQPFNISPIHTSGSAHLITFDCKNPGHLSNLASLIKRGKVIEKSELENILGKETKLLWTADTAMGLAMKKKYKIKRFKKVELLHTDREVKDKGIELITLPHNCFPLMKRDTMKGRGVGFVGFVQGYQNIKLYEVIDFEKPARSMQIGMMPAKLTHTLINIGITTLMKENPSKEVGDSNILIRDPFCWTGTTGFLANSFNYNFIGSDIKPNLAQKNKERRTTHTPLCKKGSSEGAEGSIKNSLIFTFTEQDISKLLNPITFNELLTHNTLIVTEGRLWPVIKQTTTAEQIKEYQRRVKNLYLQFIQTITTFFQKHQKPTAVFTIPIYIGQENTIEQHIQELATKLWWKMESINEIYKRENQKVWRKIIILK